MICGRLQDLQCKWTISKQYDFKKLKITRLQNLCPKNPIFFLMDVMNHNYPRKLILIYLGKYKTLLKRTICAECGIFSILFRITSTHPTHFSKLSNVFCKRHITVNNNYPL